MRSIKPIPMHLLNDSIEYEPIISEGGWDDEYGPKQTINHVRIEPTSSMNRSSDSQGRQANDTIYIDYVNSSYFPTEAKAGDRIDGREVMRVKVLKAFESIPHHLEIEVI